MKFIRRHMKILAMCASCAVVAAAAGAIASAGAATGSSSNATPSRALIRPGRVWRAIALRSVHGDVVVATRHGFETVTFDRGSVQSVSGQQLTINDGTRRATYRTVTLTIPATATVRDDGHTASLSDLQAGQRVVVVQGPNRTVVIARPA